MTREELRAMTERSLRRELDKIVYYYMQIYDEYYSTGSRDSAFLKDLVNSIQGIRAILEVYVEYNGVHPNYAIDKLNWSKIYIDSTIRYFENKLESEED